MSKIKYIWLLSGLAAQSVHAQKGTDTAALIKEFNKVMSFTVQPYLRYNSVLSLHSEPLVRETDNDSLHNVFFKDNDDLYYGNEQQEVYLQDSLMITMNHLRRSILVSKVDLASKAKMDLLPLRNVHMQKMLREHYFITKERLGGDTARIVIRSRQKNDPAVGNTTEMRVEYANNGSQFYLMEVTLTMQQPANERSMELLNRQGVDAQKFTQVKEGVRWLVMSQRATIRFLDMETNRDKAVRMPLWTEKVNYDAVEQAFRGKGAYADYEVTKTF